MYIHMFKHLHILNADVSSYVYNMCPYVINVYPYILCVSICISCVSICVSIHK